MRRSDQTLIQLFQFSFIVLARKKDGSLRLCIDYRELNKRTIQDAFALPRLDETMDVLVGSKLYSRLDLRSGYYQIPMIETHKLIKKLIKRELPLQPV